MKSLIFIGLFLMAFSILFIVLKLGPQSAGATIFILGTVIYFGGKTFSKTHK